MSASYELQIALVAILKNDSGVAAFVAGRVYDGPPPNPTLPYISLGARDVVPDDADLLTMREETVQFDIWSGAHGGTSAAARIVDAVKRALHLQRPVLTVNALTSLEVVLTRTFLDADGITAHGMVQVSALMEEN